MTEISSNEDLDTFIWATLQGTTCSQDYIDFIRHASGRPAPYEEAFLQAERYWRTTESLDAPPVSKFVQVVAEIQAQAEIGNSVACFTSRSSLSTAWVYPPMRLGVKPGFAGAWNLETPTA